MSSFNFPLNQTTSVRKNYTLASTLRKPNHFVAELLFGNACEQRIKTAHNAEIIDPIDYVFEPGQIFGFAYKSLGGESKKMHQCFVLKALRPNEEGAVIPGITPGAKILLHTNGATTSHRFIDTLEQFRTSSVDPNTLEPDIFIRLHRLLEARLPTKYFITETVKRVS